MTEPNERKPSPAPKPSVLRINLLVPVATLIIAACVTLFLLVVKPGRYDAGAAIVILLIIGVTLLFPLVGLAVNGFFYLREKKAAQSQASADNFFIVIIIYLVLFFFLAMAMFLLFFS